VQGPADKLQAIADGMITRRGILSGKMQLIAALIPQLHPLAAGRLAHPFTGAAWRARPRSSGARIAFDNFVSLAAD